MSEKVQVTVDRNSVAAGDDMVSHRYSLRRPRDTTLEQLLIDIDPQMPGTWVVHRTGMMHDPLAVVGPGRAIFCYPPRTRLDELGGTDLFLTYAQSQDPDEALAVIRAAGQPGYSPIPPLSQSRAGIYYLLRELTDELGPRDAARLRDLATMLISPDPDISAVHRFVSSLPPSPTVNRVLAWTRHYDDGLVRRTFRCGRILSEHGFYDHERALENRVAEHLPAPQEGWPTAPAYLGTDLGDIRALPIRDARFLEDLDAIEARLGS